MLNLNLIQSLKAMTANGLPFMDGKEKMDLPKNQLITITEYGFMEGEDGEFVVIVTKEYPNYFMFGGMVLTNKMKQVDEGFTDEQKHEILNMGIELVCTEKLSKAKRKYTNVEFFPNH